MKFQYIYLPIISILIFSKCSQSSEKLWLNEIQHSQIEQHIDFNKEIYFMDDICLASFKNSLHEILWDTNTVIIDFGFLFTPKNELNIRPLNVKGRQEVYFVLKLCDSNDDGGECAYEAYFYSNYFEHFRPCYFNEKTRLYVDTIIDIIPNFEKLGNNCIFKHTGKHKVYGVFESFNPYDNNELE